MSKPGFKITSLTAIVSVDRTGEEGVMAQRMPDGSWLPFIAADPERMSQIYSIAVEMSREHGIPFRVLQFTTREDITDQIKEKYGK